MRKSSYSKRPQLSNTLPYMDKPGRNWQSRHYVTQQVWWPYTDDIFLIWPHRREELDSFIVRLSQVNDTIKFIPETSLKMTNFLDVTEHTNETTSTSLFGKPTNIQLSFASQSLRGTFNNLNYLHSLFFTIEPFHGNLHYTL